MKKEPKERIALKCCVAENCDGCPFEFVGQSCIQTVLNWADKTIDELMREKEENDEADRRRRSD